ncbi:hypothetical protein HP550_20440 [Cellulomonas humilata]|uniref:Uncharacterized protein n=1 Tax=Cellulomonas humilata TaxID=144055 RepID=A0A7Y6A4G7_9CELL|nr:hypothetical protein [Cellulomonas humilata]NUU19619.1 hypothetical protein [Cellulomonas humilata]
MPERLPEWRDTVVGLRSDASRHGYDAQAVAFLDALLIVLDGWPADLPLDNLYRPFLGIAVQMASEEQPEHAATTLIVRHRRQDHRASGR